jgi:L-lactate dehydrogenase complex protein LldG
MSARDDILAAVRRAKPAPVSAPLLHESTRNFDVPSDPIATFTRGAELAGAAVVRGRRSELAALLRLAHAGNGRHVSVVNDAEMAANDAAPHSFQDTDLFVCEAVVGVAENGAVWLPQSALRHRAALFLATSVIVVLNHDAIVDNMHALYQRIDVAADAYAVLVAGPSKTADIEQQLVIGAHGAKTLTILLVDSAS